MNSKFSAEERSALVKEFEEGNEKVEQFCKTHGIKKNTFYRWRKGETPKVSYGPKVDARIYMMNQLIKLDRDKSEIEAEISKIKTELLINLEEMRLEVAHFEKVLENSTNN